MKRQPPLHRPRSISGLEPGQRNNFYSSQQSLDDRGHGFHIGKTSIYVISESENGPVKIGRSKSPLYRLSGLQTGNPRRLRLVQTWEIAKHGIAYQIEEWIYKTLRPTTCYCGGEWFNIPEALACQIVEMAISDHAEKAARKP